MKNETFSRIFKHYEAVRCCKHFLSGKVAKELQHHVRGRDSCHVHARAIRQVFYKYQIFLTLSSKWNCKITLDFKCGSAPSFSRICTQLTRWLAVANIRGVIPSWNVREKCTNIGFQYRITDHQHRDNLSFHFLSFSIIQKSSLLWKMASVAVSTIYAWCIKYKVHWKLPHHTNQTLCQH